MHPHSVDLDGRSRQTLPKRQRPDPKGTEETQEAAGTRVRLAAFGLVRALETYIIELLTARGAFDSDQWIDQDHSPLGRWKHRQLVRDGKIDGHKVGKQFFVRRDVMNAFIERHGAGGTEAGDPPETEGSLAPEHVAARTLGELGLEMR